MRSARDAPDPLDGFVSLLGYELAQSERAGVSRFAFSTQLGLFPAVGYPLMDGEGVPGPRQLADVCMQLGRDPAAVVFDGFEPASTPCWPVPGCAFLSPCSDPARVALRARERENETALPALAARLDALIARAGEANGIRFGIVVAPAIDGGLNARPFPSLS